MCRKRKPKSAAKSGCNRPALAKHRHSRLGTNPALGVRVPLPRSDRMLRRARLTVLESGASATAWASCRALGADDWIVVAQQHDEAASVFTQRIRRKLQRLRKEGAQIEAVDVYAGPDNDRLCAAARREVVQELSGQMAVGGRLTLWSASDDARADAELTAILAQFGPVLAERQIAVNHQACETEERSGVRHAIPTRLDDSNSEFDQFA